LYADDRIIVGLAGTFIADFKKAFGDIFNVQDMDHVSWLFGMTVEQDRSICIIKIGH
jgi:hypothetical protein